MSTTGPSHFAEVSGVTFTESGGGTLFNIFSVANIRISRSKNVIKGVDNNKLRPVSAHTSSIMDSVSFESEDIAALESLKAVVKPGTLVFTWVPSTNQLTASPLASQTGTISGFMIDSIDTDALSKGLGKGSVKGFLLEQSAGADPVAFA